MEQKLKLAFDRIDSLQQPQSEPVPSLDQMEEIAGLQMEIDTLRTELDQAKGETFSNSPEGAEISQIQDELRNAVAQSFELQMELEQTQARMKEMEDMLSKSLKDLDEYMAKANQSEQEAQQRIDELTNALRNSDSSVLKLRICSLKWKVPGGWSGYFQRSPIPCLAAGNGWFTKRFDCCPANAGPRYPTGGSVGSREDALKLNEEFKGVMAFTKLRDELTALEAENQRIRRFLSSKYRTSNPSGMVMQTEINNLSRENANLMAQLAEKLVESMVYGMILRYCSQSTTSFVPNSYSCRFRTSLFPKVKGRRSG